MIQVKEWTYLLARQNVAKGNRDDAAEGDKSHPWH